MHIADKQKKEKVQSGLDIFRHITSHTISKISKVNPAVSTENNIDLFAYGFGFDNPFSLLSGIKTSSIKNLFGNSIDNPIVRLSSIINDWPKHNHKLQTLSVKAQGTSPMMEGLEKADAIFHKASQSNEYGLQVLVILSDGLVSDAPDFEVIKKIEHLKKHNVVVISLYLSDKHLIKPKIIHNQIDPSWDKGAKLLAECASSYNPHSYISSYLKEYGWTIYPNGKLFVQVDPLIQNHKVKPPLISKKTHNKNKKQDSKHSVIIAYHHHDKAWQERIHKSLQPLNRLADIKLWEDTQFNTKTDWRFYVGEHLIAAQVVILLVSPNFLASPFAKNKDFTLLLSQAADNKTKVLPIILQPCRFNFDDELSAYETLNSAYQPLSALADDDQNALLKKLFLWVQEKLK